GWDIDLAALPSDVDTLHQLVRDLAAQVADDRSELAQAQAEIERLKLIIRRFQRAQFGRRSERIDGDQLALGLEDLDADIARLQAHHPAASAHDVGSQPAPHRQGLPDHLPREDVAIDIDDRVCPCCGSALHVIGETVSEMLDFVPARLRVLRIRRPKYGCRACGTIHQAAAPERPIAKGMASPGLLAHVLVSKYCDHTPLYRQSQIFARHGVEIERSTLASWVGGACWWLEPLQARLAAHVFGSAKVFADDTTIPVLDPGRGRTKTGRLWVYTRDDRPWSGPDPSAAVYFYSPDRKAERPASHLEAFRGVLQVDGYTGFERLTERGDIVLAACWAHTRRKFFALGFEMRSLGGHLRLSQLPIYEDRPQIMSYLATARKFGIWVPDERVFEISKRAENLIMEDPIRNVITEYLMNVGTLLEEGNFAEAKQHAENSKAAFAKAYAEHGFT